VIDPYSATWLAVKAHATLAIDAARKRLEATGLAVGPSENERGAIKALRGLLELGEPGKPTPKIEPEDY
jgi:hypothetical protein